MMALLHLPDAPALAAHSKNIFETAYTKCEEVFYLRKLISGVVPVLSSERSNANFAN
jgi:hypothetical protein